MCHYTIMNKANESMTDYALELAIDEALLYADCVEDVKAELFGDDYADAILSDLELSTIA